MNRVDTNNVHPCRYNGMLRCRLYVIKPHEPTESDKLASRLAIMDPIIKLVFKEMKVNVALFTAKTRKREVVDARRISVYIILRYTDISRGHIAIKFDMDRSSSYHLETSCEDLIETDKKTRDTVSLVIRELELKPVPRKNRD